MIHKAGTSHIGSCFGAIDLLTVLYMKTKPEDKILISKGWVAAPVYALLAEKGVIPKKDLNTFCMPESKYIGLLEPMTGVHASGGSMGYGLPFGVGFALSQKMEQVKHDDGFYYPRTYVFMSDGEQAIGTTWESALIAAHHRLDNLTVIVEVNGFQAMGPINEVLNIEPLTDKWKAFGWEVRKVDGHNHKAIEKALFYPRLYKDKPLVILATTTKGKGVSFFEGDNKWHYLHVGTSDYQKAMKELK